MAQTQERTFQMIRIELTRSMTVSSNFFWSPCTGLKPQCSVLAPLLFNIHTNDQPRSEGTCRFIYADDLGVSQDTNFSTVEDRLTNALDDLSPYYEDNQVEQTHQRLRCVPFTFATAKPNASYKMSHGPSFHFRTVINQCT